MTSKCIFYNIYLRKSWVFKLGPFAWEHSIENRFQFLSVSYESFPANIIQKFVAHVPLQHVGSTGERPCESFHLVKQSKLRCTNCGTGFSDITSNYFQIPPHLAVVGKRLGYLQDISTNTGRDKISS